MIRYNEDAETVAIKRKELEEKKREQEIQEWDDHLMGKGYKNRYTFLLNTGYLRYLKKEKF